MATRKKTLGYRLRVLMLFLPMLGALGWSVYPSATALVAAATFPSVDEEMWSSEGGSFDVQRSIQKHFLGYRLYLPLEDIFVAQPKGNSDLKRFTLLMRKACGYGRVYVWLPLKLRLPFIGDKVFEWCWKPKVIQKKNQGKRPQKK